jgi:hypothetical protein
MRPRQVAGLLVGALFSAAAAALLAAIAAVVSHRLECGERGDSRQTSSETRGERG